MIRSLLPRLGGLTLLLLGLLVLPAAAQDAPAEIADVPSGPARVEGRVIHAARPDAAAGVDVMLYALPQTGIPGIRRTRTDAQGRFAFEGIGNASSTVYLVGARFADVPYPGERVVFEAGELERKVSVAIADVSEDAADILVSELRLVLDWRGADLELTETLTLRNEGGLTYYVAPARRSVVKPALESPLPEGAGNFRVPLGILPEGLVQEGSNLGYFGPLYRGEQELAFSYSLPSPEGRLEIAKPLPMGTRRVVVLMPADGPELTVPGLEPVEDVALQGRLHRVYQAEGTALGNRLALALDIPAADTDPDALSLTETRLILDLDDVSLRAREEHVIRVDGGARVIATPGDVLLDIALPSGAESIRFGSGTAALGLVPRPGGGLGLTGPVPTGETTVEISYVIPVSDGGIDLVRSFGAHLPLLSVYVADTGQLAMDSERLHRRRPVRTEDRTYLHLEGFEIAEDEEVAVRIQTRPPRKTLPRSAVIGLVLLGALGALGLLTAPLRRATIEEISESELPSRRERESLYAAIQDLDHDYETGKVSEGDYEELRNDLRNRAMGLLRSEREAETASARPEEPTCPGCAVRTRPGDRFCSHCGSALENAGEREASA